MEPANTDAAADNPPVEPTGGPSSLVRALGGLCDALLMIAVLLAGWWAWDGAGVARHARPAWRLVDGSAGSEGVVLKMESRQPWKLGERPIAHDAELATAVEQSPGPARISTDDRVLFAQVARALELLERKGVRSATINLSQ